jgi:hypothetical protein
MTQSEEIEEQLREVEERMERQKHVISSSRLFQALARPEGESGAMGVKVLGDKTGVLFWMDTIVWPFHYPYCVSTFFASELCKNSTSKSTPAKTDR